MHRRDLDEMVVPFITSFISEHLLLPACLKKDNVLFCTLPRGVDGTVACESALRSAGTLLTRVRAPPLAPRPDERP
ncbi:hypothetical protein PoB_005623400 [Plakobranchus ocellatus]|uniref:Uncharacterized protein n=1 Tax=Plakobranchus ocellatus TaxID=259542 RepID=A0AAV4CG14_9GAST|nr:hypothetical protein PoB_005623400 [Plakobranchus ocellatus]